MAPANTRLTVSTRMRRFSRARAQLPYLVDAAKEHRLDGLGAGVLVGIGPRRQVHRWPYALPVDAEERDGRVRRAQMLTDRHVRVVAADPSSGNFGVGKAQYPVLSERLPQRRP